MHRLLRLLLRRILNNFMVTLEVGKTVTLSKEEFDELSRGALERCLPQFVDSSVAQGQNVPMSVAMEAERIRNRPGYQPIRAHDSRVYHFGN